MSGGADYKPVPPERLYLKPSQWDALLEGHSVGQFTSFDAPPEAPQRDRSRRPPPRRLRPGPHGAGRQPVRQGRRACEGRQRGRPARRGRGLTPKARRRACSISCRSTAPRRRCRCTTTRWCRACRRAWSASRSGRSSTASCSTGWRSSARRTSSATACRGRSASAGRRSASSPRPRRSARATWWCIASTASAATRAWSRSRSSSRATTACKLTYEGGDKLFVPVENIDVLSRYGAADEEARARSPGRRRLAVAQGAAQAAHRRHGRPADQDRRRARGAARRDDERRRKACTRNSAPASPMPRPTTSCRRSPTCSTTCRRASRWTG